MRIAHDPPRTYPAWPLAAVPVSRRVTAHVVNVFVWHGTPLPLSRAPAADIGSLGEDG
jgi:hypothetical protein